MKILFFYKNQSDSFELILKNKTTHIINISKSFDIIKSWDSLNFLFQTNFDEIKIYNFDINDNAQLRVWRHVCVLVSLIKTFRKDDTRVFNQFKYKYFLGQRKKTKDITKLIDRLKFDFFNLNYDIKKLSNIKEEELIKSIHEHYVEILRKNNYLLKPKIKLQSQVKELFDKVGLVEDIVQKEYFFSKNPYWQFPVETETGHLVESTDIRLFLAKFISQNAKKNNNILEIGSGSGFVCHYLYAMGFHKIAGIELSEYRIEGAKLLGKIFNLCTKFDLGSVQRLPYEDKTFDISYTCFCLEQCGEIIEEAILEIFRVTKKQVILFEPSLEHFSTFPGFIHNLNTDQVCNLGSIISKLNFKFEIIKPKLQHYYNPGVIYKIKFP